MRQPDRVLFHYSCLEEYDWDERTQMGTFVYEDGSKDERHQPLRVMPDLNAYFEQAALFYIEAAKRGSK